VGASNGATPGRSESKMAAGRHLGNGHVSAMGSSDSLHVWFYCRVFGVSKENGTISGRIKSKIAAGRHLG